MESNLVLSRYSSPTNLDTASFKYWNSESLNHIIPQPPENTNEPSRCNQVIIKVMPCVPSLNLRKGLNFYLCSGTRG